MNKIKIKISNLGVTGRSFPVNSKVLTGCLLDIYEKKGDLTAESVVKEAKSAGNPLHVCFEWNNAKAAHEHRLEQARSMIRCIVVERKIAGENKQVRAFVNIKRDEQGKLSTSPYAKGESSYVFIDSVMSSDILSKYTVEKALNELQSLIDKYNDLQELAGLFDVIRKKITGFKKKIIKKKAA